MRVTWNACDATAAECAGPGGSGPSHAAGGVVMSRRRICWIMKAGGMAGSYSRARCRPHPARPNGDPAPILLEQARDAGPQHGVPVARGDRAALVIIGAALQPHGLQTGRQAEFTPDRVDDPRPLPFAVMDGSRRGSSAFKTLIVSRITAFSSRRASTCRRSSYTSSPAVGTGPAGIGAFLPSVSPGIPSLRQRRIHWYTLVGVQPASRATRARGSPSSARLAAFVLHSGVYERLHAPVQRGSSRTHFAGAPSDG